MIYDVSQQELVLKVAQELKNQIEMPEWAKFVKTGVHRETMPKNPDWWYIRAASILRVTHKLGPVGVSKLRTRYGGRKNRGMRPDAGRIATPKGVSFMMNVAKQILSTKSVEKKAEKKPVKKEVSKEEKKVVESKTDKAETPAKKQETVNTEPKVKAESQKTDKPEAD